MMRIPRELQRRRDAEFERATTAHEVDVLQKRWRAEDEALALAADWKTRRLDEQSRTIRDLARRVEALEAVQRQMPATIGRCIGETVAKAVKDRPSMAYAGTYDPTRGYTAGSVVTERSGMWIANAIAPAGERPGKSPSWRLIVKGRVDEGALA